MTTQRKETMDDYTDDLGYGNPNKFICTDPACPGNCGADNHPE